MNRSFYRIGTTMARTLEFLATSERRGRDYPSLRALAQDVAESCGVTLQAVYHSAFRLQEFGLVERRGGMVRLTAQGKAHMGLARVPAPSSTMASSRFVPQAATTKAPAGTDQVGYLRQALARAFVDGIVPEAFPDALSQALEEFLKGAPPTQEMCQALAHAYAEELTRPGEWSPEELREIQAIVRQAQVLLGPATRGPTPEIPPEESRRTGGMKPPH